MGADAGRSAAKAKRLSCASSKCVWHSDSGCPGGEVPGVARHEIGTISAGRGPDQGIGQFEAVLLPQLNRLPAHSLVQFDEFKLCKKRLPTGLGRGVGCPNETSIQVMREIATSA